MRENKNLICWAVGQNIGTVSSCHVARSCHQMHAQKKPNPFFGPLVQPGTEPKTEREKPWTEVRIKVTRSELVLIRLVRSGAE